MESSDAIEAPLVTPGTRLRQAREEAGISPREMADRLNWLPAYVGAIEENQFDILRGNAFIRGYLRAYARALGQDEDEIVALYAAMDPQEPEEEEGADHDGGGEPGGGAGVWIGICLALAVLVIASVWIKQQRAKEPAAAPAAAVEDTQEADAASSESPAPSAAAAEAIIDAPAEINRDDSTIAASDVPAPVWEADPVPEPEPVPETEASVAVSPAAQRQQAAESPAGPAMLEFSFSGDCWLEVRDGAGQLIYADLGAAGETLQLDGTPPFDILAGDAAALSLTFLGEPVEVRTRPGRDTARFTVGEP